MSDLKIVFAGTPEFSVPTLRRLLASGFNVQAVLTQPDRPAGRGRKLTASPIKKLAIEHQLPVWQPESLKDEAWQEKLAQLQPDFLVVVAYGLILPQAVLDIPNIAPLNIHASLLPRWRGAAPIHRSIEAGDSETGVCIMHMQAGLDTGPVYACESVDLDDEINTGQLHDHLSLKGADLLGQLLSQWYLTGELPKARPQNDAEKTYAHKIQKSEANLDWQESALSLDRKIRAFSPWPVCSANLAGETVKIHLARLLDSKVHSVKPGTILGADKNGIDVATGDGVLRLLSIQRPGGKAVPVADYLNAHPILVN